MSITYQNSFSIKIDGGEIKNFYGIKNPIKNKEVRKFLANYNLTSADVADVIVRAAVNRSNKEYADTYTAYTDADEVVVLPATANIENCTVEVYFYSTDSMSPWWSWR